MYFKKYRKIKRMNYSTGRERNRECERGRERKWNKQIINAKWQLYYKHYSQIKWEYLNTGFKIQCH